MAAVIITPLTQALEEGILNREELKALMKRSNRLAFYQLIAWVVTVIITLSLIHFAWDSWLIWPAMFLHGIVLVHHFSLQHECVHYTVFRTRWLNEVVGSICGFIIMLPNLHFRYEHCDHHTYTQIGGKDPELILLPKNIFEYVFYVSGLPYWKNKFTELIWHIGGRLSPVEKRFVPKSEQVKIFIEARLMALAYFAIVLSMFIFDWWGLIWFWFMPLLIGEPVMRFIRMTEHVGRPLVTQMSDNTRANIVSLPWRFLCWNMNYHAEHHYAPSVPFHALPQLHNKLKHHIYIEKNGYLGAHKDILRQIFSTSGSITAKEGNSD